MRHHPTIPIPGGKGRLATSLVSHFPPTGRMYVEPCAGHGNIFWAAAVLLNYTKWWLNDVQTAPLFNAIRKLGDRIAIPERTEAEYYQQWNRFKSGDKRSIILQPYLSRNGAGYGAGGFCSGNGYTVLGYTKTIRECHRLLITTNVRVTDVDWQHMGLDDLTREDMVVFDPPYYNCDVRAYSNKFNHMAMVKFLCRTKCRWLLTEYDHDFYRKYLGKPILQFKVQLGGTNVDKSLREKRTECVWVNY